MPAITISGTIQDASGAGVEYVEVQLVPVPRDPADKQGMVIGGVGLITDRQVVSYTNANGQFEIEALSGFTFRLVIPSLQFDRKFRAPAVDVRFDLIGIEPIIESTAFTEDEAGIGSANVTIKVESPEATLDRFDVIEVDQSATRTGPWTMIEEIVIEDGVEFYEVDVLGVESDYYRARYVNTGNSDASAYSLPTPSDTARAASVIAVEELKELYLFGVNLTDDYGNPYPDRLIQHYIDVAVAWMEKQLDIPMIARNIVDEVHDHYAQDYGRWGWIQLDLYPVIRVDRMAFQYPSMNEEIVIDSEWIILADGGAHGVVQIVPGWGNIADVLLIPGHLLPMWSGAMGRIPGIWHMDYRAGFEPGTIPADIKHMIAMAASIGVLNIAGDLVAGAGIASFSTSVPGLSQSISTTSSATNAGYGARIIEYQKEIKEGLPMLKGFYGKKTRMVVG